MNNTSPITNQEIEADRHEAIRNFGNVAFVPSVNRQDLRKQAASALWDEERERVFTDHTEFRRFSTKLSDEQREMEMRNHE